MSNAERKLCNAFAEINDASGQLAILNAAHALAFVAGACCSKDGYMHTEAASGKPASKPPGQPQYVQAYKRQIASLHSAARIADRVAHDLNCKRKRYDHGEHAPYHFGGRPAALTPEVLVELQRAHASGRNPMNEAMRQGASRSGWYGWLRRGKQEYGEGRHSVFVDLYLMVTPGSDA